MHAWFVDIGSLVTRGLFAASVPAVSQRGLQLSMSQPRPRPVHWGRQGGAEQTKGVPGPQAQPVYFGPYMEGTHFFSSQSKHCTVICKLVRQSYCALLLTDYSIAAVSTITYCIACMHMPETS